MEIVDRWREKYEKLGDKYVAAGIEQETPYTFEQGSELWWRFFKSVLIEENLNVNSILDFGCGVGRFTDRFRKFFNAKTYGSDIIPEVLEVCKERYPQCKFVLDEIPKVDLVISVTSICCIPDIKLFEETCKKIRENTKYLFVFEHFWDIDDYEVMDFPIKMSVDTFKKNFPNFKFRVIEPPLWVPRTKDYKLLVGRCV